MLISFVVENFRSFDSEQEFSMVASVRQTNFPEHLVAVPGLPEKLLPVAAVFGANGAGKSNLVKALRWLRAQVIGRPFNFERFLFAEESRPSRFEVRLTQDGQVLEYGLTCGQEGFRSEWLCSLSKGGREKIVFERETAAGKTRIDFGSNLDGSAEKLDAIRVLGVKSTELVLGKLHGELSAEELPPQVVAAFRWFRGLLIVGADASYTLLTERLHEQAEFRSYASGLVHRIDQSLLGIRPTSTRFPVGELPPPIRDIVTEREPGELVQFLDRSISKVDDHTVEERVVAVEHAGKGDSRKPLDLAQESDGTKRLLNLAPAAFAASTDRVVVIDELDRSLHALLAREFVVEFLRRAQGHKSQLIFTTHETHVLDQDLLRRDEVWFVEKTLDGASELHSLDDFKVRNDLRLDRSYLLGRFGGVPHLGGDR